MLDAGYADARKEAVVSTNHGTFNDSGYWNGTDPDPSSKILDYCYVQENAFFVCNFKVSTEKHNGIYTSDHFPVITRLLPIF